MKNTTSYDGKYSRDYEGYEYLYDGESVREADYLGIPLSGLVRDMRLNQDKTAWNHLAMSLPVLRQQGYMEVRS